MVKKAAGALVLVLVLVPVQPGAIALKDVEDGPLPYRRAAREGVPAAGFVDDEASALVRARAATREDDRNMASGAWLDAKGNLVNHRKCFFRSSLSRASFGRCFFFSNRRRKKLNANLGERVRARDAVAKTPTALSSVPGGLSALVYTSSSPFNHPFCHAVE